MFETVLVFLSFTSEIIDPFTPCFLMTAFTGFIHDCLNFT